MSVSDQAPIPPSARTPGPRRKQRPRSSRPSDSPCPASIPSQPSSPGVLLRGRPLPRRATRTAQSARSAFTRAAAGTQAPPITTILPTSLYRSPARLRDSADPTGPEGVGCRCGRPHRDAVSGTSCAVRSRRNLSGPKPATTNASRPSPHRLHKRSPQSSVLPRERSFRAHHPHTRDLHGPTTSLDATPEVYNNAPRRDVRTS